MGDKLLLFHLKNKVPLEGLLKESETPPPDTSENTPKVNKNPSRVLSFSVLMYRPLPLLTSPLRWTHDTLPVCFPSVSFFLFRHLIKARFGTPPVLRRLACFESISSGMFLDDPLPSSPPVLMGSCLANNKVLELSSASTTP